MKFERPSKNPGYGPAILWCYANLFIIISSSMPSNDDDFIGMAANRLDKVTKYSVNCKRKKSNTKMSN